MDFFPSAGDVRLSGKLHPTNYGNGQPRASLAYAFRGGKGVARAGFGLFSGPFDYSDLLVSWQGASPFTNMNQPLIAAFADPSNNLVGFGPSGIVGVAGPFLAGSGFATSARTALIRCRVLFCSFLWVTHSSNSRMPMPSKAAWKSRTKLPRTFMYLWAISSYMD